MSSKLSKIDDKFAAAADEAGLAVALVDGRSMQVGAANNNSICVALNPGRGFSDGCGEFCGNAFQRATSAQSPIDYECFAGLTCRAVPVRHKGKQLVAIVGRAFSKAENYRIATDRAVNGDWKRLKPTEFFDNILMAGATSPIEKLAQKVGGFSEPIEEDVLEIGDGITAAANPEKANAEAKPAEIQEIAETETAADDDPESGELSKLIQIFKASGAISEKPAASAKPESLPDPGELSALRSLNSS